jgi:hypothetical protein
MSRAFLWSGQTEENKDGTVEPHHILIVESADLLPESGLRDRCDLVDHQLGLKL